ncbi:hypothetical protein M231_05829 [Tremella mesenterica]|uniref:Zn(2)-C6 fungal-type domain-containing protein n=1 Tax=Tremella mesenterica TaxID=5217 RepID=A0A4V1M3H9_TREME|nr:hypothetical protein M231_05829 [Tremella mesenterica]
MSHLIPQSQERMEMVHYTYELLPPSTDTSDLMDGRNLSWDTTHSPAFGEANSQVTSFTENGGVKRENGSISMLQPRGKEEYPRSPSILPPHSNLSPRIGRHSIDFVRKNENIGSESEQIIHVKRKKDKGKEKEKDLKEEEDGEGLELKGDEEAEEKMDHRKKKRNRTIQSCLPCNRNKRGCDRKRPCGRCTALNMTGSCVYEVDGMRDSSDVALDEVQRLRRRVAELEQVTRELRQRSSRPSLSIHQSHVNPNIVSVQEDIRPDRPTSQDDNPTDRYPTFASRVLGERHPSSMEGSVHVDLESYDMGNVEDRKDLERKLDLRRKTERQEGTNAEQRRRIIVDRFARFKLDEAAMMQVAASAIIQPFSQTATLPTQRSTPNIPAEHTLSSSVRNDGITTNHVDERKEGNGNWYRKEPYSTHLLAGEEMVVDGVGQKTFLGVTAGRALLRRLREITTNNPYINTTNLSSPLTSSPPVGEDELLTVPEDTVYSGVLPDIRKTFPFATIWRQDKFIDEIIDLLPNKEQSEMLLESFKEEICVFFLAWHQPTLEAEYRRFFSLTTSEKKNVPLFCLALYLMICALGSLMRASKLEIFGEAMIDSSSRNSSMEDERTKGTMRDQKDLTCSRLQSELYLSGADQALRLCSFLSNPNIYTIQTSILINVYLINSERAADAWSLTGVLVRQCIALGLHVDPANLDSKISMRTAEVKRRIWWEWTVASLDALLCISFDRADDRLSDLPGSCQLLLPPSNVIRNETTEMTFHAAYFQLTIPSYELLERVFSVDRKYSRSAIYGWFSPTPRDDTISDHDACRHTYEDAVRLALDIFTWYSHLPSGMRFDPDKDTAEEYMSTRSRVHIGQTLLLCVKTFMIVMVLHRPYLRADPSAYPDSAEICTRAAHTILSAYRLAYDTRSSIFWLWWTYTYRAFQAGAVCAFIAIRQPGTPKGQRCLDDLRGAIEMFENRIAKWNSAHPVQADLCRGLVRLEKLATAAINQRLSTCVIHDNGLWSAPDSSVIPNTDQLSETKSLSQIRAFPEYSAPSQLRTQYIPETGNGDAEFRPGDQYTGLTGLSRTASATSGMGSQGGADGIIGQDNDTLTQLWASMFGIKWDGDMPMNS